MAIKYIIKVIKARPYGYKISLRRIKRIKNQELREIRMKYWEQRNKCKDILAEMGPYHKLNDEKKNQIKDFQIFIRN